MDRPTVVTVPCFSGASWDLDQLTPLADYPLRTMRLPERLDDIEDYADFVAEQVADLDEYVVVGDSFGAVVALAFATRRPAGLRALVLSGGFAANPVTNPLVKAKLSAARFLPGALYRHVTLQFHARSLASPHDGDGQVPWSQADSRRLFLENTPWASYVARAKAAFSADYRERLGAHRGSDPYPHSLLRPPHRRRRRQGDAGRDPGRPGSRPRGDRAHVPLLTPSHVRTDRTGLPGGGDGAGDPFEHRVHHQDSPQSQRTEMIEFTTHVDIGRSPEEVFNFVVDFENTPKWNYFVTDVERRSAGPIGLGTVFHQVRKTDEQDYEVTALDSGRWIQITTTPGSSPAFRMGYRFEATDSGTRLTDHWQLKTGHHPLVERLGARRIQAAVTENLGNLKELLETGSTQLQDGRKASL